jgi:nicotinamidase-related amidase
MKALVVVDMQDFFDPCGKNYRKVKEKVVKKIDQFQRYGNKIIVVQFMKQHKICKEVTEAIKGDHLYVEKYNQGGGDTLYESLKDSGFLNTIDSYHFCGVHTCWCVHDTAKGLMEIFREKNINSKVRVLANACACHHDSADNPYQTLCLNSQYFCVPYIKP